MSDFRPSKFANLRSASAHRRDTSGPIIPAARPAEQLLIGFSLIFQFYLRRFAPLIRNLCEQGVRCHFTIGGHFPSLSHRETLQVLVQSGAAFESSQA